MAKKLSEGRKAGSGRKPGPGKTLAQGRKVGSGRKKGTTSKKLGSGRKIGSGRKKGSKNKTTLGGKSSLSGSDGSSSPNSSIHGDLNDNNNTLDHNLKGKSDVDGSLIHHQQQQQHQQHQHPSQFSTQPLLHHQIQHQVDQIQSLNYNQQQKQLNFFNSNSNNPISNNSRINNLSRSGLTTDLQSDDEFEKIRKINETNSFYQNSTPNSNTYQQQLQHIQMQNQ